MTSTTMLVVAAGVMFVTGLAHSYLGERFLLIRLFRRDNLPELLGSTRFTIGTLRFVWHLPTVVWWGIAWLALRASEQPLDTRLVLRAFSVVALVSALLPLVLTRGRHLSWAAFVSIALLLWLAAGSAWDAPCAGQADQTTWPDSAPGATRVPRPSQGRRRSPRALTYRGLRGTASL